MSTQVLTGFIRTVDPRRDLDPIADLIELCFSSQMDEDGHDYLRHIRRAARDSSLLKTIQGANERVSSPLFGYVWEEYGKIIGNLTMIPFQREAVWRYLVANVATHPDYRGLGIARQLTQTAIDHVRRQGGSAIWLQVRDDNPAAFQLYLDLGFMERARRTTWELPTPPPPIPDLDHYAIGWRRGPEWPLQEQWLRTVYPPEVAWNLNFHLERYAPGIWRSLSNFINSERIEQWSIRRGAELVGVAIWDAGSTNANTIWLAPNPACEEPALSALLAVLRRHVASAHPLSINYPAGRADPAFSGAGFRMQNTLIWMEINFESSR